jgi:hypothetical protein
MCSEFNQKISELGIKCSKCLDTKFLWKKGYVKDIKEITCINNENYFEIIRCDMCVSCFDTEKNTVRISKTSNLTYNNIPIFYFEDDNYIVRLPTVRKLYKDYKNRIDINLLDLDLLQILKYYES